MSMSQSVYLIGICLFFFTLRLLHVAPALGKGTLAATGSSGLRATVMTDGGGGVVSHTRVVISELELFLVFQVGGQLPIFRFKGEKTRRPAVVVLDD